MCHNDVPSKGISNKSDKLVNLKSKANFLWKIFGVSSEREFPKSPWVSMPKWPWLGCFGPINTSSSKASRGPAVQQLGAGTPIAGWLGKIPSRNG